MQSGKRFERHRASDKGFKSLFLNLVTIAFTAISMFAMSPAMAVHFDDIELEGNTAFDGVGRTDWDVIYAECGVGGPCPPLATGAIRQTFVQDGFSPTPDNTVFSGGLKDIHPVSKWTCTETPVQGKSDIEFAYGATYQSTDPEHLGDLLFYGGADRRTIEGDANFGIWLFQAQVDCVSTTGGKTPFSGHHLDGDLLLVAQFENGGNVSRIDVYRWTDPDGIPENGDECVGGDDVASGGNGDGLVDCATEEGIPFIVGLNCLDGGGGTEVCGITNQNGPFGTPWRPGAEAIGTHGFYEAGVNLTDLILGQQSCFASAIIETRSSTSLSAQLKDFVSLDLSTCGTLEVVKETVGGNGTFGFSVSPTVGGPDSFDLTVPGDASRLFSTVEAGTYTITEESLPAGEGWNLTDMNCGIATSGTPTGTPSSDGGSIEVTMGFGDDVVCTFENTFTPPAGTITIGKTCDGVDEGGQTFDFSLGGFGGSTTADCADGSVTLACGGSVTCESLIAGDYTINESEPTGWELTDVSCTGTSTCGPAETPDATISLGANGAETATFTNVEQAQIVICKTTEPADAGGDFDFSGDLGVFALADGECTDDGEAGSFEVAPATPYDITEAADGDFTLTDIQCDGTNWSAGADTVTITPDAGEFVKCTFTNAEDPGYIQVCKDTVTTSGANPVFSMNLAGSDADLPISSGLQHGECDFGPADSSPVSLLAGTGYSVSEDPEDGWDASYSCIGSEGEEDRTNISVSPNETVVCTVSNTQRGRIEAALELIPGLGDTFSFQGETPATLGHLGVTGVDVPPGTYETRVPKSEIDLGGWMVDSFTCDDDDSYIELNDPVYLIAVFNVDPGETVRCTLVLRQPVEVIGIPVNNVWALLLLTLTLLATGWYFRPARVRRF